MQTAALKTRERHKPESFARISRLLRMHAPVFRIVIANPECKSEGPCGDYPNPKIAMRSSTRQQIGLGCFTGLIRPCYIFCFQSYAQTCTATLSLSRPAVCRCCHPHGSPSDASTP